MKNILSLLLLAILLSFNSCFKYDNWDEPDCTFYGTVTDYYTGQPLEASQNDWQINIWERSWTGHEEGAVSKQDLRIKQDGTFQNTKLFAGTYDFIAFSANKSDGPCWPWVIYNGTPVDTIKNVVLNKKTEVNFTIIPYIQVVDFGYDLGMSSTGVPQIRFKCKVRAPELEMVNPLDGSTMQLPTLYEIRPFLSLTPFCGGGNDSSIGGREYNDDVRIRSFGGSGWAALLAHAEADPSTNTTREFVTNYMMVKSGYTYRVRMGASVNDTQQNRKYHYSEIQTVTIP